MATQYSNNLPLTVRQTQPDEDAGWRFVLANLENDTILVNDWQVASGDWQQVLSDVGNGKIFIPKGDPAISEVLDNTPFGRKAGLVRCYLDGLFRYAFYAERKKGKWADDSGELIQFSGDGMESLADDIYVWPVDHPANPSRQRPWIYGSTENLLTNSDLTEESGLKNGGGEDGNDADGLVEGWSIRGDVNYARADFSPGESYEGDYLIKIDPTNHHSGIEQSVSVTPNKVYNIEARIKEPTGAGVRYMLAAGGGDGIAATGTYANNYEYKGEIFAELDNVARNGAGNGCPGGASDGTWQVLNLEIKTGPEQTSLVIALQHDHHPSCSNVSYPEFWVDGVTLDGWGINLEGWDAFDENSHASNSFVRQDFGPDGVDYSINVNPLERFAGFEQTEVSISPGGHYRAGLKFYPSSYAAGDAYKLEILPVGDPVAIYSTEYFWTAGEEDTWIDLEIEFDHEEDIDEITYRVVYSGTNNPGPIYNASMYILPGWPAATPGKILEDILFAVYDRDPSLNYLQQTFTQWTDSAGQLWYSNVAMDINPGTSLRDLLSRFVALGYEWMIVPAFYEEGGESGFRLNVWNSRELTPASGAGKNYENDPEAPVVRPGQGITNGDIEEQTRRPNNVYVEGANGWWALSQQKDYDTDYKPDIGRIEAYVTVNDTTDVSTLSAFGDAVLKDERDREKGFKLNFARTGEMRPYLDFGIGDSMYVDLPPDRPDPNLESLRRVRSIQVQCEVEGASVQYAVDFDRVKYSDEAAILALIAQWAERAPTDITGAGAGTVRSSANSSTFVAHEGGSSFTAAASNPVGGGGDTTAHGHALSEITDAALQGDVSGQVNGKITVNKVNGIPVSAAIPVQTTNHTYVLVYDFEDRDLSVQDYTPVPTGGAAREVLTKIDATDLNIEWATVPREVLDLEDVYDNGPVRAEGYLLEYIAAQSYLHDRSTWVASSAKGAVGGAVEANVIDELSTTYYRSQSTPAIDPTWEVDCQVPLTATHVIVASGDAFTSRFDDSWLQVSDDGVAWTNLLQMPNDWDFSNWPDERTFALPQETTSRYWRFTKAEPNTGTWGLENFELRWDRGPGYVHTEPPSGSKATIFLLGGM